MAYVDPLSGSIIVQAIAAVGLAVAFSTKQAWRRALSAARAFVARLARR